jgi:hypothetical protein
MIAVDTNVLVYAHRAETALHQAATRKLVELAAGRGLWGLPVFCAGEFIRVVTHRRVFNPPSTLEEAIQFLERVVAAPGCRILRPEAGFFELLTTVAREADARGNLAFDAQIAWGDGITDEEKLIFCDAQTSGGLLIAVPSASTQAVLDGLAQRGVTGAVIGRVVAEAEGANTIEVAA